MKSTIFFFLRRMDPLWSKILIIACTAACIFLSGAMFFISEVSSIEIPPGVEKKTVSLRKDHAEAERIFTVSCSKCHKAPDPSERKSTGPGCTKGLSRDSLTKVQTYVSNVQAGKSLYESYCGRCHALIEPGSHSFDYWSKNLCTSDSCMVKRKLNSDEEQEVLLYLSAHAKRN